jgi:NAD(P)-dependent dehydrogenase (short-subunit alcohol dehydrogenase family)
MDLEGKRVVVLGGTSGFGFAAADSAARQGAAVIVASSNHEKVDRAVARLPQGAEGRVLDITDADQVKAFFDRLDPFDHLVVTVGDPLQLAGLRGMDIADARRAFEVRFWGQYTAAKFGSEKIRAGGSITLTSGLASQRPSNGFAVPASTCAAIEGLTRALAIELAPIRVNVVCAGIVRTELWDQIPEPARGELMHSAQARLPAGRVGEAADAGQAYLYLMRNGFSTGTVLILDGGGALV